MLSVSRCLALILPFVPLALGCSDGRPAGAKPTAPVTVTVLYKGAPVDGATVMFVKEGTDPPAVGRTDASGVAKLKTYVEGDGAILGSHQATVSKSETTGGPPAIDQDSPQYVPPELDTSSPPAKTIHHVPVKYSVGATSGLTAEVKSGKNEFKFDLTD